MRGTISGQRDDYPEDRSFVGPILLAVVALGIAFLIAIHFFPATSVELKSVNTQLYSGDVTFKADSIVLGHDQITHVLFVLATIDVQNRLPTPIVVDDFILTLTDSSGAELEVHAPMPDQIPNLQKSYPVLIPLCKSRCRVRLRSRLEQTSTAPFSFRCLLRAPCGTPAVPP